MTRSTTRDDATELPEFKALLKARSGAILPCDQGSEWTSRDPAALAKAADLCRSCAVVKACAAYAIAAGENDGVWGALTPLDRKRIRRRARAA